MGNSERATPQATVYIRPATGGDVRSDTGRRNRMNGRNIDQDNGTPPENAGERGTNYRKNSVSEDCKSLSSASGDEMMSREEYCYRRNLSVGFWLATVIAIINIY